MKVLFTVASMAGGGAERVISILANHLAEEGHQAAVIMTAGDTVDYSMDSRVELLSVGGITGGSMIKRLQRIGKLRSVFLQNPDSVIVSFGLGSNFYTTAAKLGLGNFLVISERNDPKACPHPHLRNLVFGFADRLVFQTRDAMECFSKRLRRKGTVIPNPISNDTAPPYDGPRKKTVVAVGRLEPQKNYSLLLRAFAAFHEKWPEYTLHIYGRGYLSDELRKMAKELGLSETVVFEGYAKNVHEKTRDAGMYVLSSDYEGISNALLEAMALGLPVISTDCPIGGSKLCITHEKNGLLVPVGDVEAMAQAMGRLAQDEGFACRLGQEAVKVRRRFSEKAVTEEWKTILEKRKRL